MLSQTTEYALRATTWLALTPGRLVSTGELAERTKVPTHYLAKVLQQIAAGGIVTGRRGVGGGYKLARAPEQIRLIEVVRCVGPLRRDGAREVDEHDNGALRALGGLMDRITADVIEMLDDRRLSDLVVHAVEGNRQDLIAGVSGATGNGAMSGNAGAPVSGRTAGVER